MYGRTLYIGLILSTSDFYYNDLIMISRNIYIYIYIYIYYNLLWLVDSLRL